MPLTVQTCRQGAIGYRLILGALLLCLPRPRVLVGHGQAWPAGRLASREGPGMRLGCQPSL
jgi:hypothetical protein